MTVPKELLSPDIGLYNIGVTMANFLGAWSSHVKIVTVSGDVHLPLPIVYGPSTVVSTSSAGVNLVGAATLSPLATSSVLTYRWSVYNATGQLLPHLQSTSVDDRKFILPPFSLPPLATYSIALTTSLMNGTRVLSSNTYAVTVQVVGGALVAAIKGGINKQIASNTPLTLDATISHDQDVAGGTQGGTSQGVRLPTSVSSKPTVSPSTRSPTSVPSPVQPTVHAPIIKSTTLTLNFETIPSPNGVTLDLQGNLYAVNTASNTNAYVMQYTSPLTAGATGTIFAGNGGTLPTALAAGASAPATSIQFSSLRNIRMDTLGNMYLAGYAANVVYKIDASGLCTIVAGKYNLGGSTGDGGAATSATLHYVEDVAISAVTGDLYIADAYSQDISVVRRVDGTTHLISTYAGNRVSSAVVNNVAATNCGIKYVSGLTMDANDNLYIMDMDNNVILYVSKATGIITTLAGTPGTVSTSGDGGLAISATFDASCRGVTYDRYGMLWVTCGTSTVTAGYVRMVDLTSNGNIITTVATGMSLLHTSHPNR